MTFDFTDDDRDTLRVLPSVPDAVLIAIGSRRQEPRVSDVRIPLDRVEEVVAGIRDAARQTTGQDDTDLPSVVNPACTNCNSGAVGHLAAWLPPLQSKASTRLYDAARTKVDATVGHAEGCEWHTNGGSYCSCHLWPAACAGIDAMYDAAMDAEDAPAVGQPAEAQATDRAAALAEAIEAAEGELLQDDTRTPEDEAYNQGVRDAAAAIASLTVEDETR